MAETSAEPGTRGGVPGARTLGDHLDSGFVRSNDVAAVLKDSADACRSISHRLRRAALTDALGPTGEINVQGEVVQKLDEIANNDMIDALRAGETCAAFASEELDEPEVFEGASGDLLVTSDPLDGSSNLDVAVSVGTIFGVLRLPAGTAPSIESFLQPGREMVAAGYAVYGSSTILVFAAGGAVNGYTLDPAEDEWYLTHENLTCRAKGSTFSINEGYKNRWDPGVARWAAWIAEEDAASRRPYSLRYVGSLVADAHRTLLKGGIFAYPADSASPSGKLRLSYEACPFAFVFETAGGAATDGRQRILDIVPERLHQRTPLIFGSADDVAVYRDFASGGRE